MFAWRKRLGDEGATLVEFALIMPIFFATVMGIMEFCFMLYNRSAIETVTHEVLRMGQTRGFDTGGEENNVYLTGLLRERIASVVIAGDGANNLQLHTRVYEDFDSRNSAWQCRSQFGQRNSVCIGQDGNSRITELTVTYRQEFLTPLAIFANGMESSVDIVSTGFMKREGPA